MCEGGNNLHVNRTNQQYLWLLFQKIRVYEQGIEGDKPVTYKANGSRLQICHVFSIKESFERFVRSAVSG